MKSLKEILYKAGILETHGNIDLQVTGISFDSRKVSKGDIFVAMGGTLNDGHRFIEQAVKSGAIAVVCERFPEKLSSQISYIKVQNSNLTLGRMASNYFNHPSEKLRVIGITGTNGKTTTASLLHNLFEELGCKSGLLSTVCVKIHHQVLPSTHTTPDALQIQRLLNDMVNEGCEFCFMEVSSHAVVQHRIEGIVFSGAVFTNLTHDHLDFHKTFEEYRDAKKGFFNQLGSDAFALVNVDDKNGAFMLQNTKASCHTYALKNAADFKARILENRFSGLEMIMDGVDVWFKLVGSFNASNLLAIYSTAMLLGMEKQEVLTALSRLQAVEGRFETITSENGIRAIIDYAHTPDALENVLQTIVSVMEVNNQIITVVGCGGDRDRAKRPVMAGIACKYSHRVIITSDNPRSESPESIIEEMIRGVEIVHRKKVLSISNRKEAIRTACLFACAGDIVLVAGKGHEKYQEIQGVKHPFDDLQVVKEIFEQLK